MDVDDRKRGCLFGLAVGDALGASVEFQQVGEFVPVTGYRSGGPHSLNAGEWTDDTSLALALADSLANGFNARDQLDKYVEWYQDGKYSVNNWCFDIGGTTKTALENYMLSGEPSGLIYDDSAGNGSIMRLAPIAIKYANADILELMVYGSMSSEVTHATNKCKSACGFMAAFLAGLINGKSKESMISASYPMELHSEINRVIRTGYLKDVVKGTGYVVESLEAALWAFFKFDNFRDSVLAAVNLGDDADTTGAVCGQFAGAYYGYSGIPAEWLDGLAKKEYIEKILSGIM